MKFKLTIATWLMGIFFCFAQTDSTQIPFVAYWSVGDNYDFLVTKITKTWDAEKLEKIDSTSYFSTFSVIDSTADSYRIKWRCKSNLGNFPVEWGELLNDNNISLEYIYRTDEYGEFQELENWQEISKIMKSVLAAILVSAIKENPKMDIEKFKQAMQPVTNLFSSREGIESFVIKELNYFHFPFGAVLDSKEVMNYEDQLPNMLGEGFLRGDSKIYFDKVDYEYQFCAFHHEMTVNEEDAKMMLEGIMKLMGFGDDKMREELKHAKYTIQDHNYFEYFYDPGIPYFIETNRNLEIGFNNELKKKEEIIRIELILD